MKKILIPILCIIVVFLAGIGLGYYKILNKDKPIVSGHTIVNALNDRGFLVTQSYIANHAVEIVKNQDGIWDKLFWQQIIKAEAITEVNMGVDLKKMSDDDVLIIENKIIAKIPPVEIFDSRVLGDINLENKQGILKKLFADEDGYNEAQARILQQAEVAAFGEENIDSANQKAMEEIKRIIGYLAPDKGMAVEVEIKEE